MSEHNHSSPHSLFITLILQDYTVWVKDDGCSGEVQSGWFYRGLHHTPYSPLQEEISPFDFLSRDPTGSSTLCLTAGKNKHLQQSAESFCSCVQVWRLTPSDHERTSKTNIQGSSLGSDSVHVSVIVSQRLNTKLQTLMCSGIQLNSRNTAQLMV